MSKDKNNIFEEIKIKYTLGVVDTIINPPSLNELSKEYKITLEGLEIRSAEEKWAEVKQKNLQKLQIHLSQSLEKGQKHEEGKSLNKNSPSVKAVHKRGLARLEKLRDEEITPEMALKMTQIQHKADRDSSDSSGNSNSISENLADALTVEDYISHQKKMKRLADELDKIIGRKNP